jgi:phosphatidylglycerophosphatase A
MSNRSADTESPPRPNLQKPTHFFACGFGSGLAPTAPGTWGSLAALPFALLLINLPIAWQFLLVVTACIYGVWVCDVVAKDLKVHDHPSIVWDEFCGMFIALLFCPPSAFLWAAPLAFFTFRFFDIKKPGPIGWLDRTQQGGWGIMADDLLAGLATFIVIQLCLLI